MHQSGTGPQRRPFNPSGNRNFGNAPGPRRTFTSTSTVRTGSFAAKVGHPAYGNSYNFGRNTTLINRNYYHDVSIYHTTQVVNYVPYQSPAWGSHWRYGYTGFSGVTFSFGFYLYSPFTTPCYVSPWYYYTCLPPYVPTTYVQVVPGYGCAWDGGVAYQYQPAVTYNSYGDYDLNLWINHLRGVYVNGNVAYVNDCVPSVGRVAVFTDRHYNYSLQTGEFRHMLVDNVRGTRTAGFQITGIRRSGNDAYVHATHNYVDQAGAHHTVYQAYHLSHVNGGYAMRDFMTGHKPI